MKKAEIGLLVLPVVALVAFGFVRLRRDDEDAWHLARPFKITVDEVTVEARARQESDIDVTVAIGHDGRAPKWWGTSGSTSFMPRLEVGDTYLEDESRKRYRKIQFPGYSWGIYAMSQTYDKNRQKYIYEYRLKTAFIPASVRHLTFHSDLAHPDGNNHITALVRDWK